MFKETHLGGSELADQQSFLVNHIGDLASKKLVVVGDIGLDEYVLGDVRRISPEAPVPVLEVEREDARIGLAANVAQNVASLGGEALLVGVIGQDQAGDELKGHLQEANVSPEHLLVDCSRPTTKKMRIMAEHHHIVRVDYEHRKYLSPEMESQLLSRLEQLVPTADGVIIEDYAKGVLSEQGTQNIIALSKKHGKKVMVDPAPSTPLSFYRSADLFTPNRNEAYVLSGLNLDDLRESSDSLKQVGRSLLEQLQSPQIIITRGKEGMSLFTEQNLVHMPTYARQVFDVTGAGDTVIAAIGLAWTAGFTLEQACVLANYAAGVVVGKVGCVPCASQELVEYIQTHAVPE